MFWPISRLCIYIYMYTYVNVTLSWLLYVLYSLETMQYKMQGRVLVYDLVDPFLSIFVFI